MYKVVFCDVDGSVLRECSRKPTERTRRSRGPGIEGPRYAGAAAGPRKSAGYDWR